MDRAAAIRKVKACMRLGASSNAHEAARAAAQARALMEKFGLSESEVGDLAFAEAGTRAKGARPLLSVLQLAAAIALGYRCSVVTERSCGGYKGRGGTTKIVFVGGPANAEICAYAFTVLRRQMDAERLEHISRVRSARNRVERGEAFAQGWVRAVAALFPATALDAAQRSLHSAAIERRSAASHAEQDDSPPDRNPVAAPRRQHALDMLKGVIKGREARLNEGIGSDAHRAPLELEHWT